MGGAVSSPFVVKHLSSGKYIHVQNCSDEDNTKLVLHDGSHDKMYFTFERVDGDWGYVIHKSSGKVVVPLSGGVKPEDNIELVISSSKSEAAFFFLDPELGTIMHQGGKYLGLLDGAEEPENDHGVVLHDDDEDGADFKIIDVKKLAEN